MNNKKNNKNKKSPGGLAIYNDFIQLSWPDREKHEELKLDSGCVSNDSIKNFNMLEESFKKISNIIDFPVIIGLPSDDVMIKFETFPEMNFDDLKNALDLNFHKSFSVSRNEVSIDIAKISLPLSTILQNQKKINILVAYSRISFVKNILKVAKNANLKVSGLEPLNNAILRNIPEIDNELCLVADTHSGSTNIIATWEKNGFLFRSVHHVENSQAIIDSILNTVQFIENKYRGFNVQKIILTGDENINFQVKNDISKELDKEIKIFVSNDPYLASDSLIIREDNRISLGLIPLDYIEMEKRRESFNLNRFIGIFLLFAFLITSIGSFIMTFYAIKIQEQKLKIQREIINNLSEQYSDLENKNSNLKKQENRAKKILDFIKDDIPVIEILNTLEENSDKNIIFKSINFTKENSEENCVVNIAALADDEILINSMIEKLNDTELFENISMSGTDKSSDGKVNFNLALELKDFFSN